MLETEFKDSGIVFYIQLGHIWRQKTRNMSLWFMHPTSHGRRHIGNNQLLTLRKAFSAIYFECRHVLPLLWACPWLPAKWNSLLGNGNHRIMTPPLFVSLVQTTPSAFMHTTRYLKARSQRFSRGSPSDLCQASVHLSINVHFSSSNFAFSRKSILFKGHVCHNTNGKFAAFVRTRNPFNENKFDKH